MRWAASMLLPALALPACSQPVSESADCAVAVRYEGTVYTEVGFSSQAVEELGPAQESSCDDMGANPQGTYFAGDAPEVTAWTLPGYDPAQVLGVRFDERSFRVLVAENLPADVRAEIRGSDLLDADPQ